MGHDKNLDLFGFGFIWIYSEHTEKLPAWSQGDDMIWLKFNKEKNQDYPVSMWRMDIGKNGRQE